MFLNLKYHIATLAAVFLALGLGILIGSTMPGGDSLLKSRQQMVSRLEAQIEIVRQKNASLRTKIVNLEMYNSIQRQFESRVLPDLVSGKLIGRNVAIIDINGYCFPEELINTLKIAGAGIQSVTLLGGLDLRNSQEIIQELNCEGIDKKVLNKKICDDIASAVLSGDKSIVDVLSGNNIIKMSGQYGQTVTDVVIIGGCPDKGQIKTNSLDYSFIDFYKSKNIGVFGVEESNASFSYMSYYQKKKIPTVDNIDTVPGQVSLVYSIAGRPGHYGIKPTAKTLMPEIESGVAVNAG